MQKARSLVSVVSTVSTQTRTAKMWEVIMRENGAGVTQRLRTPNGWLVQAVVIKGEAGHPTGVALTHVPDPNHEWKLKKKPAE